MAANPGGLSLLEGDNLVLVVTLLQEIVVCVALILLALSVLQRYQFSNKA